MMVVFFGYIVEKYLSSGLLFSLPKVLHLLVFDSGKILPFSLAISGINFLQTLFLIKEYEILSKIFKPKNL